MRRLILCALTSLMAAAGLALVPTASAGAVAATCPTGQMPFVDVAPTSFAYADIVCIRELGITSGTTATTYSPADSVTREQMARFIANLYEAMVGKKAPVVATPFTDTAASFARDDIARIYGLGITTGATPTTYEPGAFVTRGQMAGFLARLRRTIEGFCPTPANPLVDTAGVFDADIACLYGLGITRGVTATEYRPGLPVSREQMAAFLARSYEADRRDETTTVTPPPVGTNCEVRTSYPGAEEVVVSDHFALWWGPLGGDLRAVADLVLQDLERGWDVGINQLGLPLPPAAPRYCANVYLNGTGGGIPDIGLGVGTDVNGIPFMSLTERLARSFLTTPPGPDSASGEVIHMLMHLFQASGVFDRASSDSAWFAEASAGWFVDQVYPTDTKDKDDIAAYLLNPQIRMSATSTDHTPPLSWSRRYHHYGAQVWLTWLSDTRAGATDVIASSFRDAPQGSVPQAWLDGALAGRGILMDEAFAQFAARAATVDFPRNASAIEAHLLNWRNNPDNAGDVNEPTVTLGNDGTGGVLQRPPEGLAPGAWAYNTIRTDVAADGSYTVQLVPDATGSSGTAAELRGTLVRRRGATREYTPFAGSTSITAQAGDQVWLVVASTPTNYTSAETFGYQYSITRS